MSISHVALFNTVAAIVLMVLLLFSEVIAPPSSLKEAKLSCSTPNLSMSFDSMQACTNSQDYRVGCGCGPLRNPWSIAYHWGLVPILTALFGLIALRGKTTTQLQVLNATVLFVLIVRLIINIQEHDSSVMVIPLMPIIASVICGLVSGWFLFFQFCCRKFKEA